MGKFNEYTQKATPADNDTLMIYDATSKSNKLSPFSGIWNWIVGKLTNAVISNLQTSNQTVLGAINELNNNPFLRYERTYGTSLTVSNVRGATHGLILIDYTLIPFYISGSSTSGYTIATPQLPDGISVSNNGRAIAITTKATQVITCIYPYMK